MQNWPRDLNAILISFAYVGVVVVAGELMRRLAGRGIEFTRKFVHVFVGLWIIPTVFLFAKWYWAALLPGLGVVVNFLSLRFNLIHSIERQEKSDYGTVLFPLSFVICLAAFFPTEHREAAAAGVSIMALGDAAAAIVGKTFGRHPYTFLGARKSIEGSAAMLVVSFVTCLAVLSIGQFGVPASTAAVTAAVVAVVATLVEAAGKHGLDNLTVPVISSGVCFALLHALKGAPA